MKLSGLILLGVGGYLAFKLFNKGNAALNLQYSVKRIRYVGSDISKSWFDVDLGIVNLSAENIQFSKFFGTIAFRGQSLVNIQKDARAENIRILPSAETVVPVRVYLSHLQTAISAFQIFSKIANKQNVDGLSIYGTLYAGPFAVPIKQNLLFDFGSSPATPMTGIGCNCEPQLGVLN